MGQSPPGFTQATILGSPPAPQDPGQVNESLARLQIPFVANDSRFDPQVSYYASTFAGMVFVTRDGRIVYSLPEAKKAAPARREVGPGLDPDRDVHRREAHPRGEKGVTPTRVSSFIGRGPVALAADPPTFDSVALGEVWQGVDVRVRAPGAEQTEKVFVVHPGAKASRIRMRGRRRSIAEGERRRRARGDDGARRRDVQPSDRVSGDRRRAPRGRGSPTRFAAIGMGSAWVRIRRYPS